jgi:hypothetical protein
MRNPLIKSRIAISQILQPYYNLVKPDLLLAPMLTILSIFVSSLNKVIFFEETVLCLFHHEYPDLELIVIDGGSTDGSVDIIKRYEK